jgi:hypothetical protein
MNGELSTGPKLDLIVARLHCAEERLAVLEDALGLGSDAPSRPAVVPWWIDARLPAR